MSQRHHTGSFGSSGGASSLGLQGRLLEVAVVVGMDDETGLEQRQLEHTDVSGNGDKLFQMHFKAQLLDIISGTQESSQVASLILQGTTTSDPQDWRKSLRQMKTTKPRRVAKGVQRSRSVRKLRQRANKDEDVPVSTDFLVNLPCICLPDNSKVYREEHPSKMHFVVLTDISGSRHYAAVLTMYQPFYAVQGNSPKSWRLTRGRQSGSLTRLTENSEMTASELEPTKCFVPLCICFVSSLPYFDTLKNSLSCLLKDIKSLPNPESFRKVLEKYVTNLSVVLCPPPTLQVSFTLGGWPFTMFPSCEPGKPNFVTDLDLRLPLFVFMRKPATLLQVLACILLEQRLVFISENYSLITLVMEALLCYIRPFTWPHQYVPLLFSEIIDFVACPGIFLMGCHGMHKEQIEQVENDQIVVDLDTGKAYMCASYDWIKTGKANSKDNIKSIDEKLDCYFPNFIVDKVLHRLSELQIHNTVHELASPTPVTIEEVHTLEARRKSINNQKIQQIFMEMMIDLFGDSVYFLDHEINQFRTDEFMETVNSSDLPFYLKVCKTYMFKRFVQDRLRRTEDTFSRIAEERRKRTGAKAIMARRTFGKIRSVGEVTYPSPLRRSTARRPHSTGYGDHRSTVKQNSTIKTNGSNHLAPPISHPFALRKVSDNDQGDLFDSLKEDIHKINLPTFPVQGTNFNAGHFYRRCAEIVGDVMGKLRVANGNQQQQQQQQQQPNGHDPEINVSTSRAACLIVRGLYLVAIGDHLKGLEDLHATAQEDYRMFPEKTIKTIVASLSQRDLQTFRNQAYYKGDDFYKTNEQKTRNESFYYGDDELPYNPLDKHMLAGILEKSDVTSDGDVIDRVFGALSASTQEIDPEIFASFYHTWKQTRHECEVALRSLLSAGNTNLGVLQDSERLLKVSSVVSSNKGTGRLILTTRKLLFMTESYQECKHIIRLNQVRDIKLSKLKAIFHSTTALSVKCEDEIPFKVGLKSECELWRNLINEMKTGRILSRDWKDHAMTLGAAAQNVGIADAVYQSAQDEGFMTEEVALEWVTKLCNFTKLHQSGQLRAVPLETDEMLLLRIDTSPKESKKTSITNIIYSSAGIDEIPRVWVALASNKIRLIDTTQWTLDSRPIKDCNSKLSSMCVVQRNELWVGAADKSIYVIRTDTMKKSRVLHEHSAPVVSIFKCGKQVVSASSDGEVIVWNQELTKSSKTFHVAQPPYSLISADCVGESTICCCTKASIGLYALDGEMRQRLTLSEFFSSPFLESQITCCSCTEQNEIWVGDTRGCLYVWHRRSFHDGTLTSDTNLHTHDRFNRLIPKCNGILFGIDSDIAITCIMESGTNVWVGNSIGDITILNSDTLCQDRVLKAHDASVTSLCHVENRYVISGSSSKDGKIAVWRAFVTKPKEEMN
uniref:Myotubularin-related protein 13-like n=1 Tax=Phallusia mammillata TaxID=59560 RepID=A0A6F9DSC8_9ASCI|nr:myotubularin-related protein 13-like [Phallusia mammillata]